MCCARFLPASAAVILLLPWPYQQLFMLTAAAAEQQQQHLCHFIFAPFTSKRARAKLV